MGGNNSNTGSDFVAEKYFIKENKINKIDKYLSVWSEAEIYIR